MRHKGQAHWFSSNYPSQPLRFLLFSFIVFFILSHTFVSDFPLLSFGLHSLCLSPDLAITLSNYSFIFHYSFFCPPSSSVILHLPLPLSLHSYISFTILPSFINSSSLSSLSLSPLSLSLCHCASCVMSQGLISGGQPLSRWQPEQQLPGGWEGGW